MLKTIKRSELNDIVNAMNALTQDKEKNIITLRCEKIGKKIDTIAQKLNSDLADLRAEHCSKDEKGNFLHEEVIVTDKQGASRKENNGSYKYTIKGNMDLKKAIDKFWDEDVKIPVNVVKLTDSNVLLYKQIIEKLNFTQLSILSGIVLDIPLDEDGFIDDQWILNFLSDKPHENNNGQENKIELEPFTA